MRASILICCSAFSVGVTFAQSVPEPTLLSELVSRPGTAVAPAGEVAGAESSDATAEVSIVEITGSNDETRRGIRLALERESDSDVVYLDPDLASQLRRELTGLDAGFEAPTDCSGLCIHGIARCRPSQDIAQAVCPGVYSTGDGENGLMLDTPRQRFRFPGTRPSVLADALGRAIEAVTAD